MSQEQTEYVLILSIIEFHLLFKYINYTGQPIYIVMSTNGCVYEMI